MPYRPMQRENYFFLKQVGIFGHTRFSSSLSAELVEGI